MNNTNEQLYTSPNGINYTYSPGSFDSSFSTNSSSSLDYSAYYSYPSNNFNGSYQSYSPYLNNHSYASNCQTNTNSYSLSNYNNYNYYNSDSNICSTPSAYMYQTYDYSYMHPNGQYSSSESPILSNDSLDISKIIASENKQV
jgi:hypothetical protein